MPSLLPHDLGPEWREHMSVAQHAGVQVRDGVNPRLRVGLNRDVGVEHNRIVDIINVVRFRNVNALFLVERGLNRVGPNDVFLAVDFDRPLATLVLADVRQVFQFRIFNQRR